MATIGGGKKPEDGKPLENKPAGTREDQERRAEWERQDKEFEEFTERTGVGKGDEDQEEKGTRR